MATPRRGYRAGIGLTVGQILTQVMTFVRSFIVLRMLSKDDAGIGAILALTMYLLEAISDLGSEHLLVQAANGDEPRFQATAQAMRVLRGIGIAIALIGLSWPFAAVFGIPEARWAFQCIALGPLIRGLQHLDCFRMQRHLRFRPLIVTEFGTHIMPTLLAWPLTVWLRNYSVFVWLMLLQVVSQVIVSHLVAERPYRLAYDRGVARRIVAFGWPLLINGILMFVILEGDKMLIGAARQISDQANYTLGDLGVYTVAFSVSIIPASILMRLVTSMQLPLLSRLVGDTSAFAVAALRCCRATCLAAVWVAIPMLIAGGFAIRVVYGTKFSSASHVIGWLAVLQAIRVMRLGPTMSAMARGDTLNAMTANLVARVIALPTIFGLAVYGFDLVWIAAAGAGAEAIAYSTSCILLRWRYRDSVGAYVRMAVMVGVALVVTTAVPSIGADGQNFVSAVVGMLLMMVLACLLLGGMRKTFWSELRDVLTLSSGVAPAAIVAEAVKTEGREDVKTPLNT